MIVACGAHALHDGFTDLIYVMLPIWQSEFGLSFAALGLMKTVFSGTLAGFQVPSGFLAERFGARTVSNPKPGRLSEMRASTISVRYSIVSPT